MSRHVNSIRSNGRRVEFTKRNTPLVGNASNEPTVKELELMEDDYSGFLMDTPTKKMNYYLDIMRHKVAMCKHVTLNPCTQI